MSHSTSDNVKPLASYKVGNYPTKKRHKSPFEVEKEPIGMDQAL